MFTNEAEFRHALSDCRDAGNLSDCSFLLNRPFADVNYEPTPETWLGSTVIVGIGLAAQANDNERAGDIFEEWHVHPAFKPQESFYFARALATTVKNRNREMAKIILGNGIKVTSFVFQELGKLGTEVNFQDDEVRGVLDEFVASGWDVNAMERDHCAAILHTRDAPALMDWLLHNNASPNVSDAFNHTLLQLCTETCPLPYIQSLFGHGAIIDNNALHTAIRRGQEDPERLEILRLLLSKGADVDALETNVKKWSNGRVPTTTYGPPLYEAVTRGDLQVIQLLVESGADAHVRCKIQTGKNEKTGHSPYEMMRASNNDEMTKFAEDKWGPEAEKEKEEREEVSRGLRVPRRKLASSVKRKR